MENKTRKRTQKAGEVWSRFEAEMRQLVGDLAQEELPPDWWHGVWCFMERRRQQARDYVRSEYGLELQHPTWLERLLVRERRRGASQKQIAALILAFAPNPVVGPQQAFERFGSERYRDRFRAGCLSYTLYNGLRWHIQEACSAVLSTEGIQELELPLRPLPLKTTRALNQTVLNILDSIPYGIAALAGDIMALSPLPKEAEAAAFARRRDERFTRVLLPEAHVRSIEGGLSRTQWFELASVFFSASTVSFLMGVVHLWTGLLVEVVLTVAAVIGLVIYRRRPHVEKELLRLGMPERLVGE